MSTLTIDQPHIKAMNSPKESGLPSSGLHNKTVLIEPDTEGRPCRCGTSKTGLCRCKTCTCPD